MHPRPESDLTLHEAAEELGVHYMTAYRYVRQGVLPAHKDAGAWRVRHADLERFTAEQAHRSVSGGPSAAAHPAGSDRPAPMGRGRTRSAPWAQRLEDRLAAGDESGAWSVVEAALRSGHDLESIYSRILSPALVSIGARWEAGQIDIAVEHQATAIALRLIARLGPRFVRRGRSRGSVVVGAPTGETHSLPSAMLSDLLRAAGWSVTDLGADTPAESFAHAVAANDAVVAVGISVTHPDHRDRVAEVAAAVRRRVPGLLVVAGGRGVETASTTVGGSEPVTVVGSAREFVDLLDSRSRPHSVVGH